MTDKKPTLTIPKDLIRPALATELRAKLAGAGFDMAPDGQPGKLLVGHGFPSTETGLAAEPSVVVDYNNGNVTLTQI